ncbi:M15 family metallopeptidase [Salinibacterium hongtaonis]|uniref:D-alanyl-D-alanine carboxypeptidase family protein n=1 Tax=Homoserinimonas hongtaonis TaxID=2079791 RepID=A0A2U1T247_9MICO|nr:M15 family metallopeptidase [Salinibacterium hongtaonis]AWB88214.1 hypothetical protein C2138_00410 [Salinibacterium hongtaonis]PWB97952.1 D-alanyl-D-alanine carboxypeptidase family protein [Salinibacterium hongtaonis]
MVPDRRKNDVYLRRRIVVGIGALVALGLVASGVAIVTAPRAPDAAAPASTPPASASLSEVPAESVKPAPKPTPEQPEFDKAARSIDDPASIWVVANKTRPLSPLSFAPADLVTAKVPYTANAVLRAEAAAAMEQMFAAAQAEGAGSLMLQNAYRSYETQVSLHNSTVARLGKDKARAQSAIPGYSEHQTGLSADIMSSPQVCSVEACFGQTPQGIWLAENAWRFGYHLRYPADKTPVTGYIYEPWHYRYIGVELATEMRNKGITTLEEFFRLPPAPDYAPGV